MILKEIQLLFDSGALSACECLPLPLSGNYYLSFSKTDKSQVALSSQRNSDQPRVFKSVGAAVATGFKVGFQSITVKRGGQ